MDEFTTARRLADTEGVRDFLAETAREALRAQWQDGVTISTDAHLVNSNQVRVDTPVSTYIVTIEEV